MFGGGTMDPKRQSVHKVLVHSYFVALLFFLAGVVLDMVFGFQIFDDPVIAPLGAVFLVAGTVLILWAQHASHHFVKENVSRESFCRGPYRYTRNPTYWGIYLLLLGFGMVVNAFFVIVFTALSLLVTILVFLKHEEKILEAKYGGPYLEYKKSVRL